MFSETEGSRKAIGDVHVIHHEGLYHLFHLVLPNHDFIAHAISTDAIHWRRVRNSLFLGDPGSWDDLMLWTMHVSPDPHREGRWRMFYTGISRRDQGNYQRIGLALSDDLYQWKKYPVYWEDHRGPNDPELVSEAREKASRNKSSEITAETDPESCFPLEPSPDHYESDLSEGRGLVSFRDPCFFEDGDRAGLLIAARVKTGPIVRRGAVALFTETSPNHFEPVAPLLHPGLYDDLEVPNLFIMGGDRYLIGSIREDAKIRYWHADAVGTDWQSTHDNVLLPQGNYAGRVCEDENGYLLWCFFSLNQNDRTDENLLPPPKRLRRDDDGLLFLETFEGFEEWIEDEVEIETPAPLLPPRNGESVTRRDHRWELESRYGYQVFLLGEAIPDFRLDCSLSIDGKGKCGFTFRQNRDSHDGYVVSLDLLKGLAQLRAWGTNEEQTGEHMMSFATLQSASWVACGDCSETFSLLVFGSYIELSVGGRVLLTLADATFATGHVGIYLESCRLSVGDLQLSPLREPEQRDNQLVHG